VFGNGSPTLVGQAPNGLLPGFFVAAGEARSPLTLHPDWRIRGGVREKRRFDHGRKCSYEYRSKRQPGNRTTVLARAVT